MGEVIVSVIMGVYNPKAEQLEKAVKSIIKQSYPKWEMIIYNDGSHKDYQQEITRIAKLDSRITYYQNENNRGLAKALNECIHLANGKYIARMDGDDISHKKRLEKQVDFLDNNPDISWVGTSAYLIAGGGVGEKSWGIRKMKKLPQTIDFLKYSPYIHPTVMFRMEVLKENRGYNTSKITRRCEDYDLFMRLQGAGYKGYNLRGLLFAYREDKDAYVRRTFENRFNEMLVRYWGFKELGILKLTTAHCLVRPVIGGLIPAPLLLYIKRRSFKKHREV